MTKDTLVTDQKISFKEASASGPWDFSKLLKHGNDYTYKIVNISDIANAKTHAPNATYAIMDYDGTYLIDIANGMTIDGLLLDSKRFGDSAFGTLRNPAVMFPAQVKLNTTFTYKMAFDANLKITSGTMAASIDSLKLSSRMNGSVNVDAENTLTLPSGTFQALRESKIESDSTAGSLHTLSNQWMPMQYEGEDTTYTFEWDILKDNVMITALKLEYDNKKGLTSIFWYTNEAPVSINTSKMNEISIYPTFANDKLFISTNGQNGLKAEIFDVTGRNVIKADIVSGCLNIQQLKTGVYFCKLLNSNNQVLTTEKFIKK
jgi:hypothetical protein